MPGEAGAAIVSGHRDTHFASLRALQVSDEIIVTRPDGTRVHYRVDELRVADSRGARLRDPGIGRSLLLVTCWPFDALTAGGPLRYIASASADDVRLAETESPR